MHIEISTRPALKTTSQNSRKSWNFSCFEVNSYRKSTVKFVCQHCMKIGTSLHGFGIVKKGFWASKIFKKRLRYKSIFSFIIEPILSDVLLIVLVYRELDICGWCFIEP